MEVGVQFVGVRYGFGFNENDIDKFINVNIPQELIGLMFKAL